MKPYVEYGLRFSNETGMTKFTAFTQAMIRNGGRNGIALTAGFRLSPRQKIQQKSPKIQIKTDT